MSQFRTSSGRFLASFVVAFVSLFQVGCVDASTESRGKDAEKERSSVKRFKLSPEDIQPLVSGYGACIATDRITVDGSKVGYMYRESPGNEMDSGWRFFEGSEPDEYVDDPRNSSIYEVNTIANYDPAIVPLLDSPIGTAFSRNPSTGHLEPESFPEHESDLEVGSADSSFEPPRGFPIVSGQYRMTDRWSVHLSGNYSRRLEDGSLVLWKPGFTVWVNIFGNEPGLSLKSRADGFLKDRDPGSFDLQRVDEGELLRVSYRLTEDRDDTVVHALYALVIGLEGHVQMAIYFDREEDLEAAKMLWLGVEFSKK